MLRHRIEPRADWRERARSIGFDFAEIDGALYWDETAYWEFSAAEVDTLDDVTTELQGLCMQAAQAAVSRGLFGPLGIPEAVWPTVVRSWERREPSLYGRMDLRWDGASAPLLLEYNADTPTALFEASVVQWEWLTCLFPGSDQFNSMHETLIAAWAGMGLPETVHFSCMRDSAEDRTTVEYLRDTCVQAGMAAPFLYVDEIGWDGQRFVDLATLPISAMFKLYPWEFLLRDKFGANVTGAATRWIEPAWRMLLSGKGILALLWEMFPGHPNLLPAYREAGRTGGAEIRKPLWGREGANTSSPAGVTGGPYGAEGSVYQAYAELPCVDGRYPVIGSWVIGGKSCGVGIREDETPITRDTSRFVPHRFETSSD